MHRGLTRLLSILVGAALLAPCMATAQARSESAGESPAPQQAGAGMTQTARPAELEAWLQRLVGRFSVLAPGNRPARGTGECQGVGAGPGVSCLFTLADSSGARAPGLPQLMLFGVDAGATSIQLLQLDYGEPAISARGALQGDTATFTSACPNRARDAAPSVDCDRVVTIRATPGNQPILISLEWNAASQARAGAAGLTNTRIELHREPR